jgi:undecaprenyl-phosphate 4-deoxy-4-formamido-L-arabinose transferase
MVSPNISIVIPVHNEEACLETLYERLTKVLDTLEDTSEVILTNDGSTDKSAALLNTIQQRRPNQFRIIHFNGNFGQHMAIMAGFERVRGEIVITMDADLQNPPEEIPKLVEAMKQGHDVVNTFRMERQDSLWRKTVSKLHNIFRGYLLPKIKMKDEGSMLRAYSKRIVELMVSTEEASTFIPALALNYASNPVEIGIKHESRSAGETSYGFYKLIRYNFDLVTNFSLAPLHMFTFIGIFVSLGSLFFVFFLILRRFIVGPEAAGVFTLFAVLFFLVGVTLLGVGILGEYIGRIYEEVRKRPRFIISNVVENTPSTETSSKKETTHE